MLLYPYHMMLASIPIAIGMLVGFAVVFFLRKYTPKDDLRIWHRYAYRLLPVRAALISCTAFVMTPPFLLASFPELFSEWYPQYVQIGLGTAFLFLLFVIEHRSACGKRRAPLLAASRTPVLIAVTMSMHPYILLSGLSDRLPLSKSAFLIIQRYDYGSVASTGALCVLALIIIDIGFGGAALSLAGAPPTASNEDSGASTATDTGDAQVDGRNDSDRH